MNALSIPTALARLAAWVGNTAPAFAPLWPVLAPAWAWLFAA